MPVPAMADTTLVITAFRRPGYLRATLESWAAVPRVKDLRRIILALAPSPAEKQMRRIADQAAIAMGRGIEIRPDSGACAAIPGEHRALGEAISAAFEDEGCEFVISSSEDVVVSDDVLRYFAWARSLRDEHDDLLLINAHSEIGQGWHQPAADAAAAQDEASLRPAFNPWCWGTWRDRWEHDLWPRWDWDCNTGGNANDNGWDWQVWRIVNEGWHAVTPAASRARNIGQHGGTYAHPDRFGKTQPQAFREHRGDVAYRLAQ